MTKIAKWKEKKVEDLTNMLIENPLITLVNIEGIPGPQLQQLRKKLRDKSKFVISKKTLISIAMKNASEKRKGLEKLIEHIEGQTGIIVSTGNPFRLFQEMESAKIKAPAKGGEICPEDIEIKEGETSFKPGPIVGELQKAGFPAAIERGKVVIKKDVTIVEAGKKIPSDVAKVLARMDIYPLTVGLNITASYEEGVVYPRAVLDVDLQEMLDNIALASNQSFNLAMYVNYLSSATIKPLLQTGYQNAFNLVMYADIPTSDSIKILIQKANGQMLSLASKVPEGLSDDLKTRLTSSPKPPKEEQKKDEPDKKEEPEKKKEDDEKSEEDAAAGLGALFG
jgi:large subunit ribosomal protein L10